MHGAMFEIRTESAFGLVKHKALIKCHVSLTSVFDLMKKISSLAFASLREAWGQLTSQKKNGGRRRKPSKEERKIQVMDTRFQRTDAANHYDYSP